MMTTAALTGIDGCPIEGLNKKKSETLLQEKKFGVVLNMVYRR
jgi:nitroreductase